MEIRSHDMYGHEIVPLGETGYGVSTCFASKGVPGAPLYAEFTVFHVSDGFRQSLFSVGLDKPDRPTLYDVFDDRIRELQAQHPHGIRT